MRLDLDGYFRARESLLAILAAGIQGGDGAAIFSEAQKLTGGKETLENLLAVLYSLLQDILYIEAKPNGEPLRNADRPRLLMQLAQGLGVRGVINAMTALEPLERNLRRNVPSRLALEAFAMSLAKDRRIS